MKGMPVAILSACMRSFFLAISILCIGCDALGARKIGQSASFSCSRTSPFLEAWQKARYASTGERFDGTEDSNGCLLSRRSLLNAGLVAVSLLSALSPASAEPPTYMSPDTAKITHKIFMNVRISRQDGTFYVRDDLPDTPENRVFAGSLKIGLFGQCAPNHVERFLSYIQTQEDRNDDNPLPNYGRSSFPALDQATGLLTGGVIPSLQITEINGSTALRYGGRLLPAKLWIESASAGPRLTHTGKGLLTHRNLDAIPVFGVTTRSDTTSLDRSHTVFGRILLDDDARAFFDIVRDLPTYSVDRPRMDPATETVVEDAAQAVFTAQREFFRSAAKSLGDSRLDKIYEGKLLRRVEVTQVGML